jgi:YjbE family integral membrane protein
MEPLASATFWVAIGEIVWINILLSGDNAVVIALAARNLPPIQRRKAVFAGSAVAIVLRVMLTVFAVELLQLPYLKWAGALALLWIGAQLLVPEAEHEAGIQAPTHLWAAIRTILVADLAMSVDNVLAVAAAADGGAPESRLLLLTLGLGLSIPLIIFGSQLLLGVMERWPVLITVGAALLGYVAGEMIVTDRASESFFGSAGPAHNAAAAAIEIGCAVAVVLVGQWLARRKQRTLASRAAGSASP